MLKHWGDCRYEWIKPDGKKERVAVKQLGSRSRQNLALREKDAREVVKEKMFVLPFHGLYVARAPGTDANNTPRKDLDNEEAAFFVMG